MKVDALPYRLRALKGRPTGDYYVGVDLHSRAREIEVEDADAWTEG